MRYIAAAMVGVLLFGCASVPEYEHTDIYLEARKDCEKRTKAVKTMTKRGVILTVLVAPAGALMGGSFGVRGGLAGAVLGMGTVLAIVFSAKHARDVEVRAATTRCMEAKGYQPTGVY